MTHIAITKSVLFATSTCLAFSASSAQQSPLATLVIEQPLKQSNLRDSLAFPISVTNISQEEVIFLDDERSMTGQLYEENDPSHVDLMVPYYKWLAAREPSAVVTVGPNVLRIKPGETEKDLFIIPTRTLTLHTGSYTLIVSAREVKTFKQIVSAPLHFKIVMPAQPSAK